MEGSSSSSSIDGLTKEKILDDYATMVRLRYVAEEQMKMVGGKAPFAITHAGHENVLVTSRDFLQNGDWVSGYYRSPIIIKNHTRAMFAQLLGDTKNDIYSHGQQMNNHPCTRTIDEEGNPLDLETQVNFAGVISSTGPQFPLGLGIARGLRFQEAIGARKPDERRVVLVESGDATTAEGMAWEAFNQSTLEPGAPIVYSIHDNHWGISVPGSKQVHSGSISHAASGFASKPGSMAGLRIIGPVPGWDYLATRKAYEEAFTWVRKTGYPALVHPTELTQPFGHSSTGDHERYKGKARIEEEKQRDCIKRVKEWILSNRIAIEAELCAIEQREREFVRREAQAAWQEYQDPIREEAREVLQHYRLLPAHLQADGMVQKAIQDLEQGLNPDKGTHLRREHIVSPLSKVLMHTREDESPERLTLIDLELRIRTAQEKHYAAHVFANDAHSPLNQPDIAPTYGEEEELDTSAHILSAKFACLLKKKNLAGKMSIFGEDTGKIGGVVTTTLGLQGGHEQILPSILEHSPALKKYIPPEGFGEDVVQDHAIAETSIIGTAAGMGLLGLRPVAEIQYEDYFAFGDTIMDHEIACMRHRTHGAQESAPLMIMPGGKLLGKMHSGSHKGRALNSYGVRIAVPRNGTEAARVIEAWSRSNDPVLCVTTLERMHAKERVPKNLEDICVPFGHSELLRPGKDAVIITYGSCCYYALEAAELLKKEVGIDVGVVDLRFLEPLDVNGVALEAIRAANGKVIFSDEEGPNGAVCQIFTEILSRRSGLWEVSNTGCHTAPAHKPAYGQDGKYFCKPNTDSYIRHVCDLLGINPYRANEKKEIMPKDIEERHMRTLGLH